MPIVQLRTWNEIDDGVRVALVPDDSRLEKGSVYFYQESYEIEASRITLHLIAVKQPAGVTGGGELQAGGDITGLKPGTYDLIDGYDGKKLGVVTHV